MIKLKKYLLILFLCFFFSMNSHAGYDTKILVSDANPNAQWPKRFRIMDQHGLKIIGSGQFTKSQLIKIKNKINAPMILIDLRQECHGFADDTPISWYGPRNNGNKNKSPSFIQFEQQQLFEKLGQASEIKVHNILAKEKDGRIADTSLFPVKAQKLYSEQTLAQQLGITYQRFYVTDHTAPSITQVKAFKQLLENTPKDTWIYFHCRGGAGRTTTFMVLYDIFKRGKSMGLDAILDDHVKIGGKDLRVFPDKTSYKYSDAVKRLEFIKYIYQLNKESRI